MLTLFNFNQLSIPYAPFSKSDKVTRIADWHDAPADANAGRQRQGQGRRQGREAYGAAEGTLFGFVHDEDEKSFSLVDSGARTNTRVKAPIRTARPLRNAIPTRGTRGRGAGRGGFGGRGRGGARGGYGDWNKVSYYVSYERKPDT